MQQRKIADKKAARVQKAKANEKENDMAARQHEEKQLADKKEKVTAAVVNINAVV